MNSMRLNNTLYINTLLSSKEITLDGSDVVKLTELSVFNHSQKIIPLDLIEKQPKVIFHADIQWILFGMVNFIASAIFFVFADIYEMSALTVPSICFSLFFVFSLYAAQKNKNKTYHYLYAGTEITLFKLAENSNNDFQVHEFINLLETRLQKSEQKSFKKENQTKGIDQAGQLNFYTQQLDILYEDGIIDDFLLNRLREKVNNKIYGLQDKRPLANVIPLHSIK